MEHIKRRNGIYYGRNEDSMESTQWNEKPQTQWIGGRNGLSTFVREYLFPTLGLDVFSYMRLSKEHQNRTKNI